MTLALGAAALVALAALGAGPAEGKKSKGSGKMLVEPAGKEIPVSRERSK